MPCGDAQNPPSQWVCSDHPGARWEVNNPLTNNYYRILITDPTTNRLIIAPYSMSHTLSNVTMPKSLEPMAMVTPFTPKVCSPYPWTIIVPHSHHSKSPF